MSFIRNILKPAYDILPEGLRTKALHVIFLMVIQALLDFVNVGAFVPLLTLIAKPDFISSQTWLQPFTSRFTNSELILFLTIGILVFTLIKHFIVWKITLVKARFAYEVAHHVSTRILNEQLSTDYDTFTKLDHSKELNRTANLPFAFASNILIALAILLSEGLIAFLILTSVAFFNFHLLISLCLVLVPLGLIYHFSRQRIRTVDGQLRAGYPQLLKFVLTALEGWVEIRTSRKEEFIASKFKTAHKELAEILAAENSMQTLAVRYIELFAAMIICAIVILAIIFEYDYRSTLLLLGVYAGASFRFLPSVNRIMNALIQIKSHAYVLTDLHSIIRKHGAARHEEVKFNSSLRFTNIFFQYSDRSPLFQNLDLTIRKGEKVAIVGKSGSGKTTLMLMLLGLVKPTSGKIYLDDQLVGAEGIFPYRSLFSFVSQNPYLLEGSIKENIAFGQNKNEIDSGKIWEVLRQVDLNDFVNGLPEKEETQIQEKGILISGGQRQRIALARALYADREFFVFDEVTNQLDRETESKVIARTLQKIVAQDRTIVMVTHHPQLLPMFDRVLMAEDGKLVQIAPHEVFQ